MTEDHKARVPHGLRVILGLFWGIIALMFGQMAHEVGFGIVESVVIGIVGPPVFGVLSIVLAWILGTIAVWISERLRLVEKI